MSDNIPSFLDFFFPSRRVTTICFLLLGACTVFAADVPVTYYGKALDRYGNPLPPGLPVTASLGGSPVANASPQPDTYLDGGETRYRFTGLHDENSSATLTIYIDDIATSPAGLPLTSFAIQDLRQWHDPLPPATANGWELYQ